jgi:hypothetical protein
MLNLYATGKQVGINLNTLALGVFSALMVALGAMGFLMPEKSTLLSTTYSYNLFRVDIGLIGIILALSGNKQIIILANLILGAIIAYQACASVMGLYPLQFFQWTILDDILNADMGLAMILLSLLEKEEATD